MSDRQDRVHTVAATESFNYGRDIPLVSQGLNSKIQTIKKRAYGFRNRDNFKTAIYFHCGGLALYPETHSIP